MSSAHAGGGRGRRWAGAAAALFLTPPRDLVRGLDRCLSRRRDLLWVALGLLAGWWLYVPLHELLHAGACLAAGGRVTRLELHPLYGGGLLATWLPFVDAGGEYAGRLAGFDIRGSDWIYLATDLGPFVLTLLGVWALRAAAAGGHALLFGLALCFALAPFLSLTGDAYEIGSLLVTRLPWWQTHPELRGDDLLLAVGAASGRPALLAGVALAQAVGTLWAFGVYALGAGVARLAGRSA